MMKLYLLLLAIPCLMQAIQAYCIYNESPDNYYWMRQMPLNSGGDYYARFRRDNLGPGEDACCHYSSRDCNKYGNPDDVINMAFQASLDNKVKGKMFTATMTAGGWMVITGVGEQDPIIKVFNRDGSSYQSEIQIAPRGILLN